MAPCTSGLPETPDSLSEGSEVSICVHFSWMPRDSSVIGPSVLSTTSGTPNSLQVAIVMARA